MKDRCSCHSRWPDSSSPAFRQVFEQAFQGPHEDKISVLDGNWPLRVHSRWKKESSIEKSGSTLDKTVVEWDSRGDGESFLQNLWHLYALDGTEDDAVCEEEMPEIDGEEEEEEMEEEFDTDSDEDEP